MAGSAPFDTGALRAPFDTAAIRAQFPLLAGGGVCYLDSAATSQMPAAVVDAVADFDTRHRANVHGNVHRLAREAIALYEGARADIARFINAADPAEIVFTTGATSAINLAAFSHGELLPAGCDVVVSELEHHSNLIPWQMLARRRGLHLRYIPATAGGRLDMSRLDEAITGQCRLVAITHCSNVTGAITDIAPIVAAARAAGALVLVDGAQQIPHQPVDVQAMDADFYAFSGHKMFGPTGIGVLWARRDILEDMPPFMTGGQMARRVTREGATFSDPPQRFEAGTPPIAGAVGLGAAVRWMAEQDWPGARAQETRLTQRILTGLAALAGVRVIGPTDLENRRGVVCFTVEGREPADICEALDRRNVAVRGGDHCAQLLMAAYGVEHAVRASLAVYSDDEDVDAFLSALEDTIRAT